MFRWSKSGQDLLYTGGGYVCLGGPSLVKTCCTLGVAVCLGGPSLVRTCCTLGVAMCV